MAVSFVAANTVGGFGYAASPRTSSSFTPTAGDLLLVFTLGEVNSAPSVTRAGGETFSQVGSLYADGVGDFFNWETATAVASNAGITISRASDTFMFADSLEYSGVNTATSGGVTTGQTGTTASGSAQSVASGAVLVAICVCYTASGLGAFTAGGGGTIRDATNGHPGNTSTSFAIAEWSGSGGNITPSFTVPDSSQTYFVLQIVLAPAGGGTSVNLAGQSIASTQGTISRAVSYGGSGQSITSGIGIITPTISYPISGQSITSAEGAVGAAWGGSATLVGQAITSTLGVISPQVSYSVAGQSLQSQEGAVSPSVVVSLNGQRINATEGTITVPGGQAPLPIEINLSLSLIRPGGQIH